MKTAVVLFKSENELLDSDYIYNVSFELSKNQINVSNLEILPCDNGVLFENTVNFLKNGCDNLIILKNENIAFDFNGIIAKAFDKGFIESEDCFSLDNGSKPKIPKDGKIIPNFSGTSVGYYFEKGSLTVFVLSSELSQYKATLSGYVIPYFSEKYNLNSNVYTLKYFGDNDVLKRILDKASEISNGKLNSKITQKYGDTTLTVSFDKGVEKQVCLDTVRFIVSNLKDNIYAEFDTTLSERLFDLLKLRRKRISVAESFTGGRVVSEIIKNSGVSEFLHEGIVSYSNESKKGRLHVSDESLLKFGAVSSNVAYEMAVGLLYNDDCDISIATTGIAGPNSDNTGKPVGLCYIAVGTKAGVHVYEYNLSGSREEITETAKNTALFLAIKKLKTI